MQDIQLTFPNLEVKKLWPEMYKEIVMQVKEPDTLETPFEKRIRELLKRHLGADLIRNDAAYKKFFYEVLRYAINMHTDKLLYKIETGRKKYGEARHSKGKITKEFMNMDDV